MTSPFPHSVLVHDPGKDLYPTTDPDSMPETAPHLLALISVVALLRQHFRNQPDVFVIGDLFWYYEEGNSKARRAPDVMVVKGVEPHAERRGSFKSWKENAIPSFILEIVSETSVEEDTQVKRELYQRLGVREYFLFDPEGKYLSRPLLGYRLIHEAYEELAVTGDGSLPSSELGLQLRPEGEMLVLLERWTGRRLPDLPESVRLLEEVRTELEQSRRDAEQEMEQERQRADEAARQAEKQRQRAAEADQRATAERERAAEADRRAAAERERAAEADRRAAAERERAEQARQQAEEEHLRAERAREEAERNRQRIAELEAQLARLRALLPPPPPAGGESGRGG